MIKNDLITTESGFVLDAMAGKSIKDYAYVINEKYDYLASNIKIINDRAMQNFTNIPNGESLLSGATINANTGCAIFYYEKGAYDTPDSAMCGWVIALHCGSVHYVRLCITMLNKAYISIYVHGSTWGTWKEL